MFDDDILTGQAILKSKVMHPSRQATSRTICQPIVEHRPLLSGTWAVGHLHGYKGNEVVARMCPTQLVYLFTRRIRTQSDVGRHIHSIHIPEAWCSIVIETGENEWTVWRQGLGVIEPHSGREACDSFHSCPLGYANCAEVPLSGLYPRDRMGT